MRTNIKQWYHETFPTDDLWTEIKDDACFEDLFDALDHYQDVYEILPHDSIVRERCFERLAEIIGMDYDYIYEQWMRAV